MASRGKFQDSLNSFRAVPGLLSVVFLVVGIGIGMVAKGTISRDSTANANTHSIRLSVNGYKFISPLLIGNADTKKNSPGLDPLQRQLAKLISREIDDKRLSTASIYLRELVSGNQTNINPDEKYYPASLNKILIMIAYLNEAQSNPDILEKKITVTNQADFNGNQEVKPVDPASAGSTYSVEELIEKMIKNSDNNADHALVDSLAPQKLNIVSQDLNLPAPVSESVGSDYMTAGEFSLFLRILYNSTYLNEALSEHALSILSDTTFNDGLVAGVPHDVLVSHKYGLVGYILGQNQSPSSRELHDCGIIYHPQNPYLLCVMTKSSASLNDIETAVKDISTLAYQQIR